VIPIALASPNTQAFSRHNSHKKKWVSPPFSKLNYSIFKIFANYLLG